MFSKELDTLVSAKNFISLLNEYSKYSELKKAIIEKVNTLKIQ